MNKATLHFEAIFKLEPEGGYTVTIPTLPGCITYGKSIREATKMAKDAIVGYLHTLHKNNHSTKTNNTDFSNLISLKHKVHA